MKPHRAHDCMCTSCGWHAWPSKICGHNWIWDRLNVGQQCKHELWDTNDYTICGHLCCDRLHQLHVDADLLAKVVVVINHLDQLLQHVICGWLVGTVDGHFHHFVQCEFIDIFVVAAIGCPEDDIGDVAANQLGDGFDHTFFCANDQLIGDV